MVSKSTSKLFPLAKKLVYSSGDWMISSPSLSQHSTLPQSTMHQLICRTASSHSVFMAPPPNLFLFKHAGLNVLIASVIFYVQDRIREQCISKNLKNPMCLKTIPHIQLKWQSAHYQSLPPQLGSGGSREIQRSERSSLSLSDAALYRAGFQTAGRYTNV